MYRNDPVVETHDITLFVFARAADRVQQYVGVDAPAPHPATLHGTPQRCGVDRFEQIVDAVDLERPHGVIVICGGHDDPRRYVRLAEYLEAIPVGEFHVHENHIGTVPRRAQPEHRFPDRAGRPDDPYVGKMLGQRSRQVCLGHHFVFYDQYVHITATVR